MRKAPARPRLPRALRATLLDRLDGWMVAIACVSLLAHAGLVAYLRGLDFPRRPDIEDLPQRVVTWSTPAAVPRRAPVAEPAKVPIAQRPVRHASAGGGGSRVHGPRPSLQDLVARMGFLRVLKSRGRGGVGSDLLARGAPSEDADAVFRALGGVTGSGSPSLRPLDGGPPQEVHGVEQLRAPAPDRVDSGERGGERAAPARVEIEPPHGPGDVPAEQLAVEMRRRASGFRACYEHALHGGPGLRGRLELRFRLARDGRAYGVQVADDQVGDAGLARCLARVVAATPFGFGSSGEEIRVPLIFVSR